MTVPAVLATLAIAGCGDGAGPPDGAVAIDAATGDAAVARDLATATDAARVPDPCIAAGTCPPGVWTDVTPAAMSPQVLAPTANAFGPGSIAADPARPSDLYVGGGADGIWRSSDYGNTWTKIDGTIPGGPIGAPFAVAGTTPATLWVSSAKNDGSVYRSQDGGATWKLIGGGQVADLYSIKVDPYDPGHLISGLHEADHVLESLDGGATWKTVGGTGWPAGGISWYPFFVDGGDAKSTRGRWLAIAQDGASAVATADQGASWSVPSGLAGLQHPHGCAQLYQSGATLFLAGIYGPGQGVYRSTDSGATWALVDGGKGPEAVVWGTPKGIYAMWGWACSDCAFSATMETAAPPGDQWSQVAIPGGIGPNSVAVVSDGTHSIFVGVMWASGIWRYVEP